MILYKDRVHLAEQFKKWARKHNAAPYPESVIAWLQLHDLLDEEKVHLFLRGCEQPGPSVTYVRKVRGSSKCVTASELVQIHRELLETNPFQVTPLMEWQNEMMEHIKQIHEPKLEFHTADPHRDNMDHWVNRLYAASTYCNLHVLEKDAGSESEANDIHKEEISK